MSESYCEIKSRGYDSLCSNPATHFVHYFSDGSAGKYTCSKHLAKAIEVVLNNHNVQGLSVTVAKLDEKGITR